MLRPWPGPRLVYSPPRLVQIENVMSKLPLSRFKVIDLTRVRAGPTCARQLADWGADVVKVEATGGDDQLGGGRDSSDFQNLHRNKRDMALNLKHPEGVAILKRLAKSADVLVENYRADVKHRLGIDYETMRAVNPRIVYASISGFGQSGPYRDRPGFDQIAQGMGGLMSITGLPGQGPVRVGIPVADLCAGIFTAMGVLVALLEREESGEGQWVESSLLAAQVAMLDFQAARWLIDHEIPPQAGNNHPTGIPTGVFKTKDGAINIASSGNEIYRRLCDAIGTPAMFTDPQFATGPARSKNRDKLNALIEEVTRTKTSAEWVALLNEAGVPAGPINNIAEVFADPQVQHLRMARRVTSRKRGAMEVVGQAVSLSRTPWELRRPTPEHGEHTDEVLGEAGYGADEIARFRRDGIIE
jgi:crotonobetainyl-CoA:carnitine CoA-transferase CaiB-like acyl-CoA transferase